jgi:flagellar motility protein MotE (MotC chaperone)
MSFIINSAASQKTNVILKKFDDWNEWIMIVKTMIRRDDVERYVNLIKIESVKSIEFNLSIFFTIKIDAINSTDLSIDEQRDLAILREDYKNQMRKYKERIDVLKNLNIFILTSVDRFKLIYLRNQKTIHQKLSILKKRFTSTNRIRRLEIVRKNKNLQRAFKHQQMNQWLLNWEKIYVKTERLNLSDVQNDRCAYDFLNSLRTMNLSFVFDRKTILNHEINQRKFSTSIRNLLKEFRNHLRIARTLITKRATHEAFATLQEKSSNEKTIDQKESKKFSNRRFENSKIENKSCLCDRKHLFKDCYYLIEKIRSTEWQSNEEIKKKINKILELNSKFRVAVKYVKKKVKKWLEKDKKIENFDDESTQTSKRIILNVSFAEAFVEEKISYKLINCWTLNSEIDIYVCNDSDRFQLNRIIDFENQLVVDKIVYEIENYETMNIVVKKFDDSINIQLLNVALMFEFFINLICLIKMMKKEIHWNIESKRLHRKKIIFCFVESIKNHRVLEKNSSIDDRFDAFKAKSEASKSDLMITNKEWHKMLNHSKSKIIVHLAERINEIKINDLDSASFINQCEICVLIKTHEIMSRRFEQKESIDYSLSRVDYDLISMNEKYNQNFWISHFVDFYIRMNFVYTHSRKNDVLSMICEFLKTIRTRHDQIVRFIRMNDERILRFEYRDFMKMRKIATKRFVSYTSFQNDKIERFEKVLMIKIRTLRIKTNLSTNLWSKIFKAVDYLNNRILRWTLTWKTFFEILIEKKSNLSHLQSYDCRVYFLKNIISRKDRLKSKAFIDYLVRYDFTNIFRIWIFSRMQIIRIKDVIFDKTLFYDLAKFDSRHLLIINVKNMLKILEVSDNIFFEMIIKKDDEINQIIDHLKDESIESRFVKSIYQAEKTFFLHIDMKNIYLLTFEMISNRDQKFNANIIDTTSLLQISLKIDEILNSVQNQSILNSSIENESQS